MARNIAGETTGIAVGAWGAIVTSTAALHRSSVGHPGSPPPLTAAWLRMVPLVRLFRQGDWQDEAHGGADREPRRDGAGHDLSERHAPGRNGREGDAGRRVSVTVAGAVVGPGPSLVDGQRELAGRPGVKVGGDAVFARPMCGEPGGRTSEDVTNADEVHRVAAGHPASPPLLTVTVLMMDGVAMVGVTWIAKTACAPAARPAATVQVTDRATAAQPGARCPAPARPAPRR